MEPVIREARADDLGRVEELWVQLTDHVHSLDERHWQKAADAPAKFREWVAQALTNDRRALLVAEEAGTVVGFVHCVLQEGPPVMTPRLNSYISDFIVEEQARGKGIGSRLLGTLEAWCAEQGADTVTLSVAARNELGRAFWGSKGFEHWTSTMWKPLGKATGGKTPRT